LISGISLRRNQSIKAFHVFMGCFLFLLEESKMQTSSVLTKFFTITLVVLFLVMVPLSTVKAAAPIYVQPGGDDTQCDGTVAADYSVGVAPACAVKTIQRGVDLVDAGGTVNVAAGTYVENIVVNKAVELSGAGVGASIIYPALSNPNCTSGSDSLCGNPTTTSNIILVEANDVTIHGFTLDGDNPDLTSGVVVAGADIDARNGVITNFNNGTFNNLTVHTSAINNINLRGLQGKDGSGYSFHDNTLNNIQGVYGGSIAIFISSGSGTIQDNFISNVGDAISANWSKGIQVLYNTITSASTGIHSDNAGGSGGVSDLIQGNTISNSVYGIFTFAPYNIQTINANTITNCAMGLSAFGSGTSGAMTTSFTNNVLTDIGTVGNTAILVTTTMYGWGFMDVSASFSGNIITGYDNDLYLSADDFWVQGGWVSKNVDATFTNNNFEGNNIGPLMGTTGTYSLNLSGNWWGTADPAEVKAYINGGVGMDYTPWLASGTDTSPDMGFQGDFSTLYVDDDSPQIGTTGRIQEGVDMVSGSTVYVLAGDYTEQITINKSVDLIGAGESTTTVYAPDTRTGSVVQSPYAAPFDYLLAAYATSDTIDVHIEGFTFDIDEQNKTAGTNRLDGVFLRDVKDAGGTTAGLFASTIHNFDTTTDYESWGLEVRGDSLLTADDLDIHDYTRDGLLVAGDGAEAADPIVTISNNTITGSAAPLQGINIMDVSAGTVSSNTVTGNTRSAPWAAVGILLSGSSDVSVSGNHVDGNFYGIDIAYDSHDLTIAGNELTDNIKRAISLDNSDNNIISGNTITGPLAGTDDVGIGLANSATGNIIGGSTLEAGNTINLATTGTGLLYAVHLDGSLVTGDNTIRFNTITGGQRAVQFDNNVSGTTTVSNNIITSPAWGGITAYNNGNLIITNNTLTNAVRPLEFFGPVNLTVTGNTISNPTYFGINLGSFTGTATVSGNIIHGLVEINGIWAQTAGAGLDITGNTIYDITESNPEAPTYAGRGIQINATADGVNIDSNVVYNNSSFAGICIDTGATGAKINNNYIYNNLQGIAANEQTVEFNGNLVVNNRYGIDLNGSGASFILRHNSITGNDTEADSYGLGVWNGTADLENNWWGCNEGPTADGSTDCDTLVINSGAASDADPWLVLKLDAPSAVVKGIEYDVTASLTENSVGEDTSSAGHVYDGIESLFTATLGSLNPTAPTSLSGLFSTVYSTATSGTDHVCVTVDSEQVCSADMSPLQYFMSIMVK
jgi:parallel beta-helix repeat protein